MSRETPIENYRNVGISAHIDAGKTTTTERILYYAGIKHKIGEVHEGTTAMDWMEQEQERGITITSASTTILWQGMHNQKDIHHINIIDTPGHVDFTIEVERTMRVLDGVCLLYCGVGGVQPQSETVWRQSKRHKVPSVCFVNKMDRQGANFRKVCDQIKAQLGANPIPITMPLYDSTNSFTGLIDIIRLQSIVWDETSKGTKFKVSSIPVGHMEEALHYREKLLEVTSETNEVLLSKYLNNAPINEAEIVKSLRQETIRGAVQPVVCGSAFKNKGIQVLLDALIDYLPSPADLPPIESESLLSGKTLITACSDTSAFLAIAFKIMTDVYVGQLTFLRVYSGVVRTGDLVLNASKNRKEKIGRILQMHANNRKDISEIYAGDIAAVVGIKEVTTGDTFSAITNPQILEKITFPEPVISQAIEPITKDDQSRLSVALSKLTREDPSFRTSVEDETNQTVISGMGELHLEIMVERLRREFNVRINTSSPEVSYRETIKRLADKVEGKFIKQSGGKGQYGHVVITVEPNEGRGYEFADKTKGGVIPKEYISAVNKGIQDALGEGIQHGYQVTDIKVTLTFGSYHEVDSNEHAFRMAGSLACRKALIIAEPTLLEPIMMVEVEVPDEYLGTVMGDILGRRGVISSTRELGYNAKAVEAEIPLVSMFGYSTSLRSLTQGRGVYTMKFKQYKEVKKEAVDKLKLRNPNRY